MSAIKSDRCLLLLLLLPSSFLLLLLFLLPLLLPFCLLLHLFMFVYTLCMHYVCAHTCMLTCVWKQFCVELLVHVHGGLRITSRVFLDHSQHLMLEGRVSQSIINKASLARQLALGIHCLYLLRLELQANHQAHLYGLAFIWV